jgi:hypothetical protein
MDLSFLIPSAVRRAVLQYWVENPDAQMGIRELARALNLSPQQTFRELINLESWGMLFSSSRGNQRAVRLNPKFRLFPPIRDLFERYQEEQSRKYEVHETYKMEDLVREIGGTPIPAEMLPRLMERRKKPRSYEEEKILKRIDRK